MVTVDYAYEIHHNSIIDLFCKDYLRLKSGAASFSLVSMAIW